GEPGCSETPDRYTHDSLRATRWPRALRDDGLAADQGWATGGGAPATAGALFHWLLGNLARMPSRALLWGTGRWRGGLVDWHDIQRHCCHTPAVDQSQK